LLPGGVLDAVRSPDGVPAVVVGVAVGVEVGHDAVTGGADAAFEEAVDVAAAGWLRLRVAGAGDLVCAVGAALDADD
ncbi:MAG TPA: hypothetical protein DIS59_02735, partial [Candidatus Magasanikbacteria bacterium]|nr:hypothetical protein [Candidatus Magasanikbacteria bacterium]